jgi:hypothetical protein
VMKADGSAPDDLFEDDFSPDLEMDGDDGDLEMPGGSTGIPVGRVDTVLSESDEGDDEDDNDDDGPPARPMSDDEITMRVRRLLRSDSATSMLRIHVSTEDGVVTLQGMVQTLDDTDNAAEVAMRVDGVIDVTDELEVEP